MAYSQIPIFIWFLLQKRNIFNRKDFISSLENIGYELIDTWRGYDSCYIPFHKNKSIT